jgi:hypothetical protein
MRKLLELLFPARLGGFRDFAEGFLIFLFEVGVLGFIFW